MRHIDNARYAIYWAPHVDSGLSRIGSAWLGRDATTDLPVAQPAIEGFDAAMLAALTAEPRRYGLHATLKPPFRLAAEMKLAALVEDLVDFAAGGGSVVLPSLKVVEIDRFLALGPSALAPALNLLANACVEHFDHYRAPASPEELVRRNASGLTPAQAANLSRWGYPYVMDEYRFHVSLTARIDRLIAKRLVPALEQLFEPAINAPLAIDEIALFIEESPGAPFRILQRFAFGHR